jgi:hypothetical protein
MNMSSCSFQVIGTTGSLSTFEDISGSKHSFWKILLNLLEVFAQTSISEEYSWKPILAK